MKKRVIFLMCFTTFCLSMAEAANYIFAGVWTGGNSQSGALNPICPCADQTVGGINRIECNQEEGFSATAEDFLRTSGINALPEVCYDEYVPQGANGWVHALIFRRSNENLN